MILEGPLAEKRRELGARLTAAGIESRPIVAGNFTRNPAMRYLDATVPDTLAAADALHDQGLFVGNRAYETREGIDLLHDLLVEWGAR